jgi:acetyl esterase/lipase
VLVLIVLAFLVPAVAAAGHEEPVPVATPLAAENPAASSSAAQASSTTSTLPAGTVVETGSYGDDPVQRYDLYLPAAAPAAGSPLIIWMHGGGWVSGDRTQLSPAVQRQLTHGVAVASIDYHLIGDGGTFPVPIIDTKLAVRYFKANADRWHLRPDKVLVGGFSAGGYNASFAALSGPGFYEPWKMPEELRSVDSSVAGVIDEAGPTDFQQFGNEGVVVLFDTAMVTTQFLGCPTAKVSSCDPLTLAASRLVPLVGPASPPIYLVYGGRDPLVPASNGDVIRAAYHDLGLSIPVDVDVVQGYSHSQDMDHGIDQATFDGWVQAIADS